MRKAKEQPPQPQPSASAPADQPLPGMSDRRIHAIETAAHEYALARDVRRTAKKAEDERKASLIVLMHKHAKTHYKRRGLEVTIEGVERVTVEIQDEGDHDDDDVPDERRRPRPAPDPTPEQEPPQPRGEPPAPEPRELM